jgi:hypothetical protein
VNNVKSEIPSTISGITTGIYRSPSITLRPLNLYLYIPIAAIVPIAVDSKVLIRAIAIVVPNDCKSEVFSNSFTYQSNVNPFHVIYGFVVVALNEPVTITIIGRNRKRYTKEQNIIPAIFFIIAFDFLLMFYTPKLSISPPIF